MVPVVIEEHAERPIVHPPKWQDGLNIITYHPCLVRTMQAAWQHERLATSAQCHQILDRVVPLDPLKPTDNHVARHVLRLVRPEHADLDPSAAAMRRSMAGGAVEAL